MVQVFRDIFLFIVSVSQHSIPANIPSITHTNYGVMCIPDLFFQCLAICRASVRVATLVTMAQHFTDCLDYLAAFFGQQCKSFGLGGCQPVEMLANPALNRTRNSGRVLFIYHNLPHAVAVRLAVR
jgi:hypothetical protein